MLSGISVISIVFFLLLVALIYVLFTRAFTIVPERESVVVERFGKRGRSLSPGFHFLVPFVEIIVARITSLEQHTNVPELDVITSDNALLKVNCSLFYKVVAADKAIYQTDDLKDSLIVTAAGIVRSELGKFDFDQVQTNRSELNESVKVAMEKDLHSWGVVITRAEILQVEVDEATKNVMLQQLNAERARRAVVSEAEGTKRAKELEAEGDLYASEQAAKARRIEADAEAYATEAVSRAIKENGIEALQYQIALKQVETLEKLGNGQGKQTVIVPADFVESFGNAFKMITKQQ